MSPEVNKNLIQSINDTLENAEQLDLLSLCLRPSDQPGDSPWALVLYSQLFVIILVKHLVSGVLFAGALTAPQAFGADARLRRLHDELRGQKLLDLLQDVALHLQGHVVDVVVQAVVHDCVLEHQHDVPLELGRGPDEADLNVLLDGGQVHGPEEEDGEEVKSRVEEDHVQTELIQSSVRTSKKKKN